MRARRERTAARQAAPGSHQEAPRQGCEGRPRTPARQGAGTARGRRRTLHRGRCHAERPLSRGPAIRAARVQDACYGGRSEAVPSRRGGRRGCRSAEGRVSEADASAGDQAAACRRLSTPSLPLSRSRRSCRPSASAGRFIPAAAGAAGRAKGRTQDRRARADGRRAAARREVPRVLGRRLGRRRSIPAPSSRPTSSSRTPA